MDFKNIINKVAELNDEVEYVKAPELDKAPQLNEDQELRMLAGLKPLTESAVAEIVEEAEEVVSELDDMKTGEKKKSATGGTIEKTATGYKHHGKKYGGSADDEEDKDDDMDEAVETEAEEEVVDEASEAQKKAREKFMAMVKGKKAEKDDCARTCVIIRILSVPCNNAVGTPHFIRALVGVFCSCFAKNFMKTKKL